MDKRWTWVLALPYVVVHSSSAWFDEWDVAYSSDTTHRAAVCYFQQDCEDLAAALNEAHERRTAKPSIEIFYDKKHVDPHFDYKSACEADKDSCEKGKLLYWKESDWKDACGQDDCGKEPK